MGRTLPTECDKCDGVLDWGDFGAEDGSSPITCECPPEPSLIDWLKERRDHELEMARHFARQPAARLWQAVTYQEVIDYLKADD